MIKDAICLNKNRHWNMWAVLVCTVTQQWAWCWHLLAAVEDQRQRGDLRLTDRPTCSPFSFLSLSNPSVAAVKWWNLSTVTLKRRKGRNDLINAGSSITNSVEQNLGEPCSHTVWSLHSPEITAAEHVSVMKLKHMPQMMKFIWH